MEIIVREQEFILKNGTDLLLHTDAKTPMVYVGCGEENVQQDLASADAVALLDLTYFVEHPLGQQVRAQGGDTGWRKAQMSRDVLAGHRPRVVEQLQDRALVSALYIFHVDAGISHGCPSSPTVCSPAMGRLFGLADFICELIQIKKLIAYIKYTQARWKWQGQPL